MGQRGTPKERRWYRRRGLPPESNLSGRLCYCGCDGVRRRVAETGAEFQALQGSVEDLVSKRPKGERVEAERFLLGEGRLQPERIFPDET